MEQFARHERGHRSRIKTTELTVVHAFWLGFDSGKFIPPYYLSAFRALIEGKLTSVVDVL